MFSPVSLIKKAVEKIYDEIGVTQESKTTDAHILKNFPYSIQLNSYSCGLQSAFSILKYYGKARTKDGLKRYLGDIHSGTSETKLIKLFKTKGLSVSKKSKATMLDIKEAIDKKKAPLLIYLGEREHWVVIYGYSPGHLFVMDPMPVYLQNMSLKFRTNKRLRKEIFNEWDKSIIIVQKK